MTQNGNRSGWSGVCGALLACTVFTGPALRAQTQQIERPAITSVSSDLQHVRVKFRVEEHPHVQGDAHQVEGEIPPTAARLQPDTQRRGDDGNDLGQRHDGAPTPALWAAFACPVKCSDRVIRCC